MDKVQIIAIVAAVLFFLQVLYFTAKNKLQDQQAFIWLLLAIAGIIIAIFMNFFNFISEKLGIAYMPTLIFLVAFLVILNLLIYHTISISKHQEKIKILTQEIAFLTKEVNELKNKQKKDGTSG